jgi:hypothetical protein
MAESVGGRLPLHSLTLIRDESIRQGEYTMLSAETKNPTIHQRDALQSAWTTIRLRLETEKTRIYEAIGNYPAPIAACDQQFNYLLEERTRISQELDRLKEATAADLTLEESIQRMDEFIRSSVYIDPEAAQSIRSSLKGELSRLYP